MKNLFFIMSEPELPCNRNTKFLDHNYYNGHEIPIIVSTIMTK